jgi:hypothetical protein
LKYVFNLKSFFIVGFLTSAESLIMAAAALVGDRESKTDFSVEWVCQKHSDLVALLFSVLNPNHPGLEQVKTAMENRNWPAACRYLLDYYRRGSTANWLRHGPVPAGNQIDTAAAAMLEDTYTFYGVTAKIPRLESGNRNWDYRGPDPMLGYEWTSCLNRQDFLTDLLGIYYATGNVVYVRYLDECLGDWVIANPPPAGAATLNPWSPINVGLRMMKWPALFYGLQQVDEFREATRILMLASAWEQGRCLRMNHSQYTNHLLMEMNGLTSIALAWPEFADAAEWLQYAKNKMTEQLAATVYPDGVHNELTDSYHQVAQYNFQHFQNTLCNAGQSADPIFDQTMEKMWNYLAYAMRPDGYGLHNNEADLNFNRTGVVNAAKTYKRADWAYIASNGREGEKPSGLPSVVFPWAGQVIMRSGWEADAQWLFFDIGPSGVCHENLDKLHLSASAFGRDWLVDSGRYTYSGDDGWRSYFMSSAAHNVILIDGQGQKLDVPTVQSPLPADQYRLDPVFDFVRGTFDKGYEGVEGRAVHTRAVFYLHGRYWVVVDCIDTDRPRTIQPLWHFHPDCAVNIEQDSVIAAQTNSRLTIIPISDLHWNIQIVKGQTEPCKQGWYSAAYGSKVPSPVAVYSAPIPESVVCAWLLVPAADSSMKITARLIQKSLNRMTIQVGYSDASMRTLTLPLDKETPNIDVEK